MIITLCILAGIGAGIWLCCDTKEFSWTAMVICLLCVGGILCAISTLAYSVHCDIIHTTPVQEETYELATFEKTGDTYVISNENEILENVEDCEVRFDPKCSTPYAAKEVIYHNHWIFNFSKYEDVNIVVYIPTPKGV